MDESMKAVFLKLIDEHKNKLIDPVEMLHWTYLRLFILSVSDAEYDRAMGEVLKEASK